MRASASCCSRRAVRTTTRRSTTPRGSSSCGTASRTGATAPCPRPACADRELQWPRGKVLGGSSALNGMIYVRGARSRLRRAWAVPGERGWGYAEVLPLFKRSEDFDRGRGRVPRGRRAAARDVAVRAAPGQRRGRRRRPGGRDPVQRRPQRRAARRRGFAQLDDQGRRAPERRDGVPAAGRRRAEARRS